MITNLIFIWRWEDDDEENDCYWSIIHPESGIFKRKWKKAEKRRGFLVGRRRVVLALLFSSGLEALLLEHWRRQDSFQCGVKRYFVSSTNHFQWKVLGLSIRFLSQDCPYITLTRICLNQDGNGCGSDASNHKYDKAVLCDFGKPIYSKSSDESCCGCLARKLHHHFSTSTKEGTSSQPRCLCRKMMSQEVL